MARWVYILQSQSTGRFYCGQTNHLQTRLEQHNDPTNDLAKTTKRFEGPWQLTWSRQVESGSAAVRLERQIKKEELLGSCKIRVAVNPATGGIASGLPSGTRKIL